VERNHQRQCNRILQIKRNSKILYATVLFSKLHRKPILSSQYNTEKNTFKVKEQMYLIIL